MRAKNSDALFSVFLELHSMVNFANTAVCSPHSFYFLSTHGWLGHSNSVIWHRHSWWLQCDLSIICPRFLRLSNIEYFGFIGFCSWCSRHHITTSWSKSLWICSPSCTQRWRIVRVGSGIKTEADRICTVHLWALKPQCPGADNSFGLCCGQFGWLAHMPNLNFYQAVHSTTAHRCSQPHTCSKPTRERDPSSGVCQIYRI